MTSIVWELEDGRIQAVEFDATVRQSHEASATATEHPVEQGANISDHVRPNLDRITLEVVVSNTPINVPKTQMDGVGRSPAGVNLTDADGVVFAKANVLVFDGEVNRVRTVYEQLIALKDAGEVVDVLTSLREYEDMVLLRVSPIREAASGDSLVCTVEARHIRIVDSEIVKISEADAEQSRDETGTNRGRQNTEEDDDPRNSSILNSLGETLGIF